MLFNSQQPGLSWKHMMRKQGSSCLGFISSLTSKNLYYTADFWSAWMSACSVDVRGVHICRENSHRDTQCSWIAPGQHLLQQSMLGKRSVAWRGKPPEKKNNKTPTLDSHGRREQWGRLTAKTHNFWTFTVLLNTTKLYTPSYRRIRIKTKNTKKQKTLCVIIFKQKELTGEQKQEVKIILLNRDVLIHFVFSNSDFSSFSASAQKYSDLYRLCSSKIL